MSSRLILELWLLVVVDVRWSALPWVRDPDHRDVSERVRSRHDGEILTRLARWDASLDTWSQGVIRHDYVEEVYLLEGEPTDLTLGETFTVGPHACGPPRMPHGPDRTTAGCRMQPFLVMYRSSSLARTAPTWSVDLTTAVVELCEINVPRLVRSEASSTQCDQYRNGAFEPRRVISCLR